MTSPGTYGRRLASALLAGWDRTLGRAQGGLGDLSRITKFARGRLEFRPRSDDIYVVSYPRSGTTWVLHLVHLLTRRGEGEFDHLSQVCPWFERGLAVGAFSAADLEALPSPRVFKSHLPHAWLPQGGRRIYVARDGLDVAVSYYHFYRSHLSYEGSLEQFLRRFLDGDVQYRAWFDHLAGWESHRSDPQVCLLKYEQLRADLPATLERVAAFLGVPLENQTRAVILERCSFDYMKANEEKFDFAGEFLRQHGYRAGQFLRRGVEGEGRGSIPAALQAEFQRRVEQQPERAGLEWRIQDFLH